MTSTRLGQLEAVSIITPSHEDTDTWAVTGLSRVGFNEQTNVSVSFKNTSHIARNYLVFGCVLAFISKEDATQQ